MNTFKELDEAHSIGDRVIIKHGSEDIKGKEGRIGEIRKGPFTGAPKTFTVDYDHNEKAGSKKSVQLKSNHFTKISEETVLESDAAWAAAKEKEKENMLTPKDKSTADKIRQMMDKEKKKVKEDIGESALDRFRKASAEREKEANKREAEMKARHAAGKEDMKGAINTLASRFKTEATDLRAQLQRHSDAAIAANKAGDDEKVKLHQNKMNAIKDKMAKQARNEAVDKGEYDYEGQMARTQLQTILRNSEDLIDMIEDDENMPEWVQSKITLAQDYITTVRDYLQSKEELGEGTNLEEGRGLADKYYKMAQDRKETAHENKGNHEVYHTHMADHHDHMSRYHEELGQHSLAQAHTDKADIHHEKSMQKNEAIQEGRDYDDNRRGFGRREREDDEYHVPDPEVKKNKAKKEDVAANNVGGGNIAGTQGDAGKKAVMTKKPMKRNVVQFKEFADAELDEGKTGLWANIHAKRKRIKNGSGERMRKPGSKGAPTAQDFKDSQESVEAQFDMIEDFIEQLALSNGVDSEIIWEDLETVDDLELLEYAIDAKGHKSSTGGLTQKGVDHYNAKTGGNLQTAVTTKPSKLKPGSKAANRRKSFCARMGGVEGPMKDENGKPTRKALALRKWNC